MRPLADADPVRRQAARRTPACPAATASPSTGRSRRRLTARALHAVGWLDARQRGEALPLTRRARGRRVVRRRERPGRQGPGKIRAFIRAARRPPLARRGGSVHRRERATAGRRPMNKPDKPNSFRNGPDERGHFGIFGGRFVAETLMPLILELERPTRRPRPTRPSRPRSTSCMTHYVGRPWPLYFAERLTEHCGGAQDLLQARGAEPHRRAQDQQRARPDPAGAAHGQDAHHRRDRRRPARRRDRHRLRALRPRMRRLHGRRRRRAAEAERLPHEDARRRGRARCSPARAR